MKLLSETAKLYQLEHGHMMFAELKHGEEVERFQYGLLEKNRSKTMYVHGAEGGQTQIVLETVCWIKPELDDKITLETGDKGRVESVSIKLLDDRQLRFVGFERAEKITRITISNL